EREPLAARLSPGMAISPSTPDQRRRLRARLSRHLRRTGSRRVREILAQWATTQQAFEQLIPVP
ncbi:MAG: hypothetical protein HQL87_11720, partial [Magnetococcales bacterium]|nr:hypothetical protein [Magnetococcales bacterium]